MSQEPESKSLVRPALRVHKHQGEASRHLLKEWGFLEPGWKFISEEDFLFLPLTSDAWEAFNSPGSVAFEELRFFLGIQGEELKAGFVSRNFALVRKTRTDWKDLLEADPEFPDSLLPQLPGSFDLIGHVLLLKLSEALLEHRHRIGEALLTSFRQVETVVLEENVSGEFRIRGLELLAGKQKFETRHREHGLNYLLDIRKVYFSPRLATERERVLVAVRNRQTEGRKENILDMFAGVGPFALLLAKKGEPASVVAIDKNPEAVRYLKENIMLNQVSGVEALEGDAGELAREFGKEGRLFDRIIMNFPTAPDTFFRDALAAAAPGAIIYFYRITSRDWRELEAVMDFLRAETGACGRKVVSIETHGVGSYSASASKYCFTLVLDRGALRPGSSRKQS